MKKIQLQSIGYKNAVEAKEVKIGDVLIWNFGYTEKVTDISKSKNGNTLYLNIECESGYKGCRTIRGNRLVALAHLN